MKGNLGWELEAWLPRSICEFSGVIMFYLFIKVIYVYVFVQTHKTVHVKYVCYILYNFYFSEVDISKQDNFR